MTAETVPAWIRPARSEDAATITRLIHELAASIGEASPLDEDFTLAYMDTPGAGVLVADVEGQAVGTLSYTLRPNLYHAAPSLMIEELIVDQPFRRSGIGGRLLDAVLAIAREKGCAELSVSTTAANTAALNLYRMRGFQDEAVLLEHHLESELPT